MTFRMNFHFAQGLSGMASAMVCVLTTLVDDDYAVKNLFLRLFSEMGPVKKVFSPGASLPIKIWKIEYETRESAVTAVEELNYTQLDGIVIHVILADDETTNIIREGVFSVCNALREIEIPASVEEIGACCFSYSVPCHSCCSLI